MKEHIVPVTASRDIRKKRLCPWEANGTGKEEILTVTTNNITETLVALIALAGEIPKDINIAEVSRKTLQNQISKNKKEQILKIDQKHNRIRLLSPKGPTLVKNLSNELYTHYMMVSNNHNFKTSSKAVTNQRLFSESVLFMLRNGYQIDNIEITHISNHFGQVDTKEEKGFVLGDGILNLGSNHFSTDGRIEPLISATSFIQENEKRFYTSKYLKLGYSVTDRINTSRTSGIMMSEGNMYNIYFIEDMKIFPAAEKEMTLLTNSIYKNAYGKKREKTEAIFVTNFIPSDTSHLNKAFDRYHIIPNNQDGDYVLKILETKDWERRLRVALYGEQTSTAYDGTYGDDPSWEVITGDYEKIKRVKRIAQNNRVNFICLKWQEPIVREIAKRLNYSLQVLTEEQKNILLNYIKEES